MLYAKGSHPEGGRSVVEEGGRFFLNHLRGNPFYLYAFIDGVKDGKPVRFYTQSPWMATKTEPTGPVILTLDKTMPAPDRKSLPFHLQ